MDTPTNVELRTSKFEIRNSHSALSSLTDHWQAQGWPLDTLVAFRMEGEGAAPSLDSIIDAGLANEPAEPTPEPTPAAAQPDAAPAPEPEIPVPGTRDPGTEGDTFDRKYVEELRAENAKYRTERNQLQETFGQAFAGYDPADRDNLLTAARMLQSDDPAERAEAAEWMRDTGSEMLAAGAQPTGAAATAGLTAAQVAAEVDRVLSAREQTKAEADAQAQRLTAINDEVKGLGLEPGSVDAQVVLGIALHETNGDIKAAHEKLVARDKAAVDRFLAAKAAEADNGTGIVPQTGGSSPAPTEIKSIKDAKAALEARFDALGFK